MSKEISLILHGTSPTKLTAAAIVQAAKSDLAAYAKNEARKKERKRRIGKGERIDDLEPIRPTGFLAQHLKDAKKPSDVIAAALHDRAGMITKIQMWEAGNAAAKIGDQKPCPYRADTILLCRDKELLIEALRIANESD